jgi:hypothetical protein
MRLGSPPRVHFFHNGVEVRSRRAVLATVSPPWQARRYRAHFAVHSAKISVHLTNCRKVFSYAHLSRARRSAVNSMSTVRGVRSLTVALSVTPSCRSVRRGCFREASHKQDGMRCPAGRLVTGTREASETRPPPLRADVISAFTRVFDALWSSQNVEVARTRYLRGTDRHKPRGGAPRGERSRWSVRRDASRLRTYVIGPLKGAAAPERLSALRFPRLFEGQPQTSEEIAPREKDHVCARYRPVLILVQYRLNSRVAAASWALTV